MAEIEGAAILNKIFPSFLTKKELLLAGLAVLTTLFVFNGAMELIQGIRSRDVHLSRLEALEIETAHSGAALDRRTKMEVVGNLRAQGRRAWPSAYTHHILESLSDAEKRSGQLLIPLGFISNADYVLCNELGQWAVSATDRYGFNNNDQKTWGTGRSKERAVILIGDSMVEGQCVEGDETIASKLRQAGVRAISFGAGGSGPIRELAILKEYGFIAKPEFVFWFFTEANDLEDVIRESEDVFLSRYLRPDFSQGLSKKQSEIDGVWKKFLRQRIENENQEENATAGFLRQRLRAYFTMYQVRKRLNLVRGYFRREKGIHLFRQVLQLAKKLCEDHGANLVLVYMPSRHSISRENRRMREFVKGAAAHIDVSVLDFHDILLRRGDLAKFFPGPKKFVHYKPNGYQVFAHEVGSFLKARGRK